MCGKRGQNRCVGLLLLKKQQTPSHAIHADVNYVCRRAGEQSCDSSLPRKGKGAPPKVRVWVEPRCIVCGRQLGSSITSGGNALLNLHRYEDQGKLQVYEQAHPSYISEAKARERAEEADRDYRNQLKELKDSIQEAVANQPHIVDRLEIEDRRKKAKQAILAKYVFVYCCLT